ncbi:MAG TPA: glycine cleavage system aminomethyltransferase GcvT [Chloroflexia bacterium]|nr:glycine cleavage system aminomethyltransferase GcvT [Chloroflexia bacterium]
MEDLETKSAEQDLMAKKEKADDRAAPADVAEPLRTPLYEEHLALGARMVEFGGWMMPVQYENGIIEEHKGVRSGVGIFDTCHMGEFVLRGPDAVALANTATTNNVAALGLVQAQYTFITNHDGGVQDDSIVYNFGDHVYVVVNAAPLKADWEWLLALRAERGYDVEMTNESDDTGKLDVQGPEAAALMQRFTDTDLATLKFFWATKGGVAGVPCRISRTGYTGEDGFELFFPAEETVKLWRLFVENGAQPSGLGCRDTLRLEASLPLSGSDVASTYDRNPIWAGFGRFVKLDKPADFVGRAALERAANDPGGERLINFHVTGRGVPRQHCAIAKDGATVGEVSSGSFGPTLDKFVGMGWVQAGLHGDGTELDVIVRDKPVPIVVVPRPMYKKPPIKK